MGQKLQDRLCTDAAYLLHHIQTRKSVKNCFESNWKLSVQVLLLYQKLVSIILCHLRNPRQRFISMIEIQTRKGDTFRTGWLQRVQFFMICFILFRN